MDWDDASIIERMTMGGDADDIRSEFDTQTSGYRGTLAELATSLQPVIDRGDPLDYLFDPIAGPPGAPPLGEQLDQQAAEDYWNTGFLADPEHVEEIDGAYAGERISETVGEGNTVTDLPVWGLLEDVAFAHMQQAFEDGDGATIDDRIEQDFTDDVTIGDTVTHGPLTYEVLGVTDTGNSETSHLDLAVTFDPATPLE